MDTSTHGAFMARDDVSSDLFYQLEARIASAAKRYGPFASTHEALGVAAEEWDELREQIRANNIVAIRNEALDLAAVMLRLAQACDEDHQSEAGTAFGKRSIK